MDHSLGRNHSDTARPEGDKTHSGLVLTKWPHSNRNGVGRSLKVCSDDNEGRSWLGAHINREHFIGEIINVSMVMWSESNSN